MADGGWARENWDGPLSSGVSEQLVDLSRRIADVRAFIEGQPGAVGMSFPSAPRATLYKVAGKVFAILTTARIVAVSLKCDPELAEILRERYEGIGHWGHLDRRHWISVRLDSDVPLKEIRHLIGGSYALVCAKLTRKQRAALEASS
jgi:predicted DNA-binding protein (MmcQ/YjbR family)